MTQHTIPHYNIRNICLLSLLCLFILSHTHLHAKVAMDKSTTYKKGSNGGIFLISNQHKQVSQKMANKSSEFPTNKTISANPLKVGVEYSENPYETVKIIYESKPNQPDSLKNQITSGYSFTEIANQL
tara:strand:+ start:865 stop:1248 length:384 start_codon:yes stop_codon:yes gene_type:complete